MQNTPQKPEAVDTATDGAGKEAPGHNGTDSQQIDTALNADNRRGHCDYVEDEVIGGGRVNAAIAVGDADSGKTEADNGDENRIDGGCYENINGHGHNTNGVRDVEPNGNVVASTMLDALVSANSHSGVSAFEISQEQSPASPLHVNGHTGEIPTGIMEHFQAAVPSSELIPSLLKDRAIYGDLLTESTTSKSAAFDELRRADDDSTEFVDGWPVTYPEEYDNVAREAHSHWRSRLKQPTEALEQSISDIRDFILGSSRRRIRLVLIQLYGLIEKAPKIYELLEYKQNLESTNSAQAWLERNLNSLWVDLKTRCSLLILNEESRGLNTLNQIDIPDAKMCDSKLSFAQSLVLSTVKDAINNCVVLWDHFDSLVRGLVLVDSGEDILRSILLAPDTSPGIQNGGLRSLLSSYPILPDLYKLVIRNTVEAIAVSTTSGFRLVASEIQQYRVLPGVLFRAFAHYGRTTNCVDEVVQRLDTVFSLSNASLWIGNSVGHARPKYAKSGVELYELICSYFFSQNAGDDKQRQTFRFMRVISGLVGFLQLEVNEAFLDIFKQTECFALDSSTADVSAAMLLVLVGFGKQTTAQTILDVVSGVSNPFVAARIDSLVAHLLTDHMKPVAEFVNSVLGMDFAYPNERLFYLKDVITQSKSGYFSSAAIARRLISKSYPKQRDSFCCSPLQRTAILYFLQAGVFQENGVDVRQWFLSLVWAVDAAAADDFGAIVKAYVSAIFASSSVTPLPETTLWKVFSPETAFNAGPSDSVSPPQVLCILYLLYYCESLAEQIKGSNGQLSGFGNTLLAGHSGPSDQSRANQIGAPLGVAINRSTSFDLQHPHTSSIGRSSLPIFMFGAVRRGEYSDQLLDLLPVSWIVRCVSRSAAYRLIWPELLSMVTAQFPDQLDVVAVLQHELSADMEQQTSHRPDATEPHSFYKIPRPPSSETFNSLVNEARGLTRRTLNCTPDGCARNSHLFPILSTIEQYFRYPVAVRMETCAVFSEYLCRIALQNSSNVEIVTSICQAWFSLHGLNPHIVSTATANAWRAEGESSKPRLIPQDIWLDPLVLFRSDPLVFESPGLSDILLTILAEFLVLSRTCLRRIHSFRQLDGYSLKRPHVVAMVQLQESSALQILIELATLSHNDAVRALIFEFIHARFLEQRVVQKLVHFQAYELDAIEDMVKNVPSMHACSEFIPEMLMQSFPRLQLFSIRLAASITSHYPIVANEGMTKEVILPHIQTTLMQMAGTLVKEQLDISNAMFETLISISSVFPLVRQDCVRLVNMVRAAAIEKAQTALQPNNQQQRGFVQNIAQWIGSCNQMLDILDGAKSEANKHQYTRIEDVDSSELISMIESTAEQPEKPKHFASKPLADKLADTSIHQPAATLTSFHSGPPQATGLPARASGQPPPHSSPSLPQSQAHSGPASGNQKRPHYSAIGSNSDHPSRMMPLLPAGKRETGGTGSSDFGRGRSSLINTSAPNGPPAIASLSDLVEQGTPATYNHRSPSASPAQTATNPGAGGGAVSGLGASTGFKKRNRHRSRPLGGKEIINGGKVPGIGVKRSRVSGGDRQHRSKDH
ncbi:hypothetical protein IWW48_000323 [Coemansia sp. RSA 1200]|nr:hypothetical protein IWW48_000323 [Coemansia sp. RSA 1200]